MYITPSSYFDILSVVSLIGTGALIVFSRIRQEDLKLLRGSNNDLRTNLNDRMEELKKIHNDVTVLKERVTTLEDKNGNLSELVKEALVVYFELHPRSVREVEQTL